MGLKIPRRAISVQVRLLPAAPVQIPHTETGRAGNPATKNPGLKPGFLNSSTRTLTSRHDARHGASRLHARGASHARHGHGRYGRDARLSRDGRMRNAWRLPGGGVQRARDALLRLRDVLYVCARSYYGSLVLG